jgi:hypothetical protein
MVGKMLVIRKITNFLNGTQVFNDFALAKKKNRIVLSKKSCIFAKIYEI